MTDPPPAKKPRTSKAADCDIHITNSERTVVEIQFRKAVASPKTPPFDALLREYCRFLQIKLSDTKKPFAPSYIIDQMWHAHILSTREYHAFCDRHNGGLYLHHNPTLQQFPQRYSDTVKAYQDLFQEKPSDPDIWPPHWNQKPKGRSRSSAGAAVAAVESTASKKKTQSLALAAIRVKQEEEEEEEEDEDTDDDDQVIQGQDRSDDDSEDEDQTSFSDDSSYDTDTRKYLEVYGDERGRTPSELQEWHRKAILDPSNNEGFDPREHLDTGNCEDMHRWYDGEFYLTCRGCRESSRELGGFSCG